MSYILNKRGGDVGVSGNVQATLTAADQSQASLITMSLGGGASQEPIG